MHRSELGKPLPDDFTFEFNPLWQMSDVDRSTVAVNTTNAISTALGDGLMTRKAAMTDLRENSDVTGIGASITDEDIENAEDEAPPDIGELGDKPPEPPGGDSAYRAEVIVPGIDLSRKVKPTAFKRDVLSAADKTLVRQVVGDADIRKLPKQSVDMAFNAVSEIAKGRNTRSTTGDAQRPNMGMTSIASLNKQNADFWSNRKG